ncbi:MAG: hypothetical protein SGCHY_003755 [Lobulomycetales sp.]
MSAHILAVAQLLLLFPIAAFGQQVQLPPLCQSQCATFSSNFARCATNTTPNNRGQWNSAALTIANCICPVIESDTSCQNCVVQNYGMEASTQLLNELKSNCDGGQMEKTATVLMNIWGQTRDLSAGNSWTPSDNSAARSLTLWLAGRQALAAGVVALSVLVFL